MTNQDILDSIRANLLPEEAHAIQTVVDFVAFAPVEISDQASIFNGIIKDAYGVDLASGETFEPVEYDQDLTLEDFVNFMWRDENWYQKPEPTTYRDTIYNLRQWINDGMEVPVGITAYNFTEAWNALCEE